MHGIIIPLICTLTFPFSKANGRYIFFGQFLGEARRRKQQQNKHDVGSLSRKTRRWAEKKRFMFLLSRTCHLDKKISDFLKSVLGIVVRNSFVKSDK